MGYCSTQSPRSFRQNALHQFEQFLDLDGLHNLHGQVEQYISKQEPVTQTKANKRFVHCEGPTIV